MDYSQETSEWYGQYSQLSVMPLNIQDELLLSINGPILSFIEHHTDFHSNLHH